MKWIRNNRKWIKQKEDLLRNYRESKTNMGGEEKEETYEKVIGRVYEIY